MKFVIIPGDGVGEEISAELEKICQALENYTNIKFNLQVLDLGLEHYQKSGVLVPEGVIKECARAAAVWVGPITEKAADGTVVQKAIINQMTAGLNMDTFSREISPFNPNVSQLTTAPYNVQVLQENLNSGETDDIISSNLGMGEQIFLDFSISSRSAIKNLIDYATKLLEIGERRTAVIALPDSQISRRSGWGQEFTQISQALDFPISILPVDKVIFKLLHRPEDLDLILTIYPFGAVFSKIGAALEGGLGLGYEAYINSDGLRLYNILHPPSNRFRGKNAANPIGAIRALADILHRLNRVPLGKTLDQAVEQSLEAGWTTRDMGGSMGTSEIGDFICNKISELNP